LLGIQGDRGPVRRVRRQAVGDPDAYIVDILGILPLQQGVLRGRALQGQNAGTPQGGPDRGSPENTV
jgi:hypothetical protein